MLAPLARRAALAVAVGACLAASQVAAGDGDAMGVTLTMRAFTGLPHDVVVAGDLAHVALDTGLAIYDIADPASPLLVSELYLPSPAFDLALSGSNLLVASGESGLAIIDISDPVNPVVTGRLATQGTLGVAVSGSVACLAEASDPAAGVFGLRTVSVADPLNPVALGFVPLANGAIDVALAGGRAFVGVGSDQSNAARGLAIIDVSNPSAPSLASYLDVGQPVNEVALEGSMAYLASGFPFAGALVAVDVLDAANPGIRARHQLADAATGVSIAGGVAQVAARSLGVLAFDVSGSAPLLIDALPTGRQTWSTFTRGDVVFVGERSSTGVAGFTTVSMQPLPQGLSELASVPFAEALDVAAIPGAALMLRRVGLALFDPARPGDPPLSTWNPLTADLSVLAASPALAAVSEGRVARLVDIVDPMAPVEVGQVTVTGGVIADMQIVADTLFVADGRGLDTFSVSSPSSPSALGSYRTAGWASAIAVDGDRACLAAGTQIDVLDVSSPSSPVLLGSLDLGDQIYGVALAGDLAVVTGHATALATVDLSDPTNPILRATTPGGPGFDVILANDRAIVASGERGIDVFNVTDPAAPVAEAYFDTSGSAVAVAIEGASLQVATSESQQWILNCPSCVAPCNSSASVFPLVASICEGETLLLDGSASAVIGCAGTVLYQWFEDGVPVPGATSATFSLPTTLSPGAHRFTLVVECSAGSGCTASAVSDVSVASDAFPLVDPASLRVNKVGGLGEAILSWSILSGRGDTNVHRSLDVLEMTDAAIGAATIVRAEPTTGWTNDLNADNPSLLFYKVFGRRACTGLDGP